MSLLSDDSGNYALNADIKASEHYQDSTYNLEAKYAVDGDMSTRWGSNNNCESAYLELTLKEKSTVNSLTVRQHTGGGISANLSTVSLEYKTEGPGNGSRLKTLKLPGKEQMQNCSLMKYRLNTLKLR